MLEATPTPTPAAPDQQPTYLKIVCKLMAIDLCVMAGLQMQCYAMAQCGPGSFFWLVFFLLAIAGLMRRLRWGRWLTTIFGVVQALWLVAWLLPDLQHPGNSWVEQAMGGTPPAWAWWVLVVAASALLLAPLVLMGRGRAWFRRAWW